MRYAGQWRWVVGLAACAACRRPAASRSPGPTSAPDDELTRAPPPELVIWHELRTSDPAAAASFYSDVVGWRSVKDSPDHFVCFGDAGPIADLRALSTDHVARRIPPHWIPIVEVEDVDEAAAKGRLCGGQIFAEPVDTAEGRVAALRDPGGAEVHVDHSTVPTLSRDRNVPSEFWWNEVATTDERGTLRFYADVFGWSVSAENPVGERGKYLLLSSEGAPTVGIFVEPTQGAHRWMSYVQVRDLDVALRRAVERGASILYGPEVVVDGRMAKLRDPQGAYFGLHETPPMDVP